jgi:hypothetical protein
MNITRRIQVWHEDVSETTIPDRELACFKKPLEGSERAETILVTNDYEDIIDTGTARVHCIPVTKFLLFDGSPMMSGATTPERRTA